MAKCKNGKVHNIYLIDKDKLATHFISDDIKGSLELLIAEANSKLNKDNKYKPQTISQSAFLGEYNCCLYFANISVPQNSFKNFFTPFIDDKQGIVKAFSVIPSFVMFLYKENYVFCITGGNGHNVISKYLVPKFGLKILSNYTNDFRITSYGDNSIDSKVHAQQTTYRKVASFIDLDRWDKVFNSMFGKIENKEIISELLHLEGDQQKESISIKAKDSMQIGNKLNISKLIGLLEKYENLLIANSIDNFNIFIALDKKQSEQIATNNSIVIKTLFNEFAIFQTQNVISKYDFFAEEIEKFINCSEINILYDKEWIFQKRQNNFDISKSLFEGFKKLIEKGKLQNTESDFAKYINSSEIACFENENLEPSISENIMHYLSGELNENGKTYFVFYGRYYLIEQNYTKFLNERLSEKLKKDAAFISITNIAWSTDEDRFNADCRDKESFIHLHKIVPDNIEFCDLLKFENGKANIVHVKNGFDGKMRDLSRQVELSHKCLQELKNTGNEDYFSKLYDRAIKSDNCSPNLKNTIQKSDFINNLKTFTPIFIIGLYVNDKELREIEKFESNIVKHCLYDLFLYMKNNDKDFKIQIIKTM